MVIIIQYYSVGHALPRTMTCEEVFDKAYERQFSLLQMDC